MTVVRPLLRLALALPLMVAIGSLTGCDEGGGAASAPPTAAGPPPPAPAPLKTAPNNPGSNAAQDSTLTGS